jgi:hypothetical protein
VTAAMRRAVGFCSTGISIWPIRISWSGLPTRPYRFERRVGVPCVESPADTITSFLSPSTVRSRRTQWLRHTYSRTAAATDTTSRITVLVGHWR